MDEQSVIEAIEEKKDIQSFFNPFPGLRPFGIEESHLFFGREGQSEEVLQYLAENRFVAVVGSSGSGKSSLMYCGLVPILYGGFITEAGSRWRIITTRPGNDPVSNLADALVESESADNATEEDTFINRNITRTILRTSSQGLVEAVKMLKKPDYENILIMVDQFEELFRFKQGVGDNEAFNESESFVKLLVEAVQQREAPIYIILTMRSDYIGDCSQFQELTELINLSNYLIPQMTREDFKNAITGPVAVGGGKIDSNLVQQLLNDIGDNPDQLPILQHALMRTWEHWTNSGHINNPVGIEDYEAVGKMEKALSEHANEAFDELSPNEKVICATMFKSLTERGADNRGIRRPTRFSNLMSIAGATNEELTNVVNTFRKAGRSFLTPSYELGVSEKSVIDISHESLMRVWTRLKSWVDEESNSVQMYSRLSEAAGMYQEGKTSLWRPPDLHLAISWRNSQKPTLEWARRYNPAFERAMVFLDTSEKEFKAEEQNKIKLQKRALKRTRIFAIVLGSAAIISLGFLVFAITQTIEANKQKENAVKQQSIAEEQSDIAKRQAEIADSASNEAQIQAKIAEEQSVIATQQATRAEEQSEIAKTQAKIAEEQSDIAKQQATRAEEQSIIAKRQAEIADSASKAAYNLRMLSIGQSMAVKSAQLRENPELKALLAYQAYLFNIKYEGIAHNADMFLGLYEALKSNTKEGFNKYLGHGGIVQSTTFANDGKSFYSIGDKGAINQWNITDTSNNYTTLYNTGFPRGIISVSKDGRWLACGPGIFTKEILLFDLQNNNKIKSLTGHKTKVSKLLFTNDSKNIISTANDGLVILWNIADTSNITKSTLTSLGSDPESIALSHNDNLLAVSEENGNLNIIHINDQNKIDSIYSEESENAIYAMAFDQNNKQLAFGDNKGSIKIYDMGSGQIVFDLRAHNTRVTNIKYSPDNKILASASRDASIRLWEASNLNTQPFLLTDHESMVLSIDFSPDGKYLISAADKEIIIWPIQINYISENVKKTITRNFTKKEWETYVGVDIPYEKTIESID